MFNSSETCIPRIEAINVGEPSVMGIREATIHVHQEQLESYVYKNVDFAVGQEIHWNYFSCCLFSAIAIPWYSSATRNIVSIEDLNSCRTGEVFIRDVMVVYNTCLIKRIDHEKSRVLI